MRALTDHGGLTDTGVYFIVDSDPALVGGILFLPALPGCWETDCRVVLSAGESGIHLHTPSSSDLGAAVLLRNPGPQADSRVFRS